MGEIPPNLCQVSLNDGTSATENIELEIEETLAEESVPDNYGRNGCDSIACPAGSYGLSSVFPCRPCDKTYLNPYLGARRCFSARYFLQVHQWERLDGGSK
jgi:hypothetical protein